MRLGRLLSALLAVPLAAACTAPAPPASLSSPQATLITTPRYLICDEPTSMLDVSTQAALFEAIADHARAHAAGVLLVTHDRLLAEHWCDRIIELPALDPTQPSAGLAPHPVDHRA